jgi:flagellar biosynthesis/type III secretory pathway protein FliH
MQEELFKGHKEQIAKLSVAIAQKILAAKIENGQYEIEAIVQEALENTSCRQDISVHLNPQDLTQMQKAMEQKSNENMDGIRFVPDANIGRAECMIETTNGIIEATIEKHLGRIYEALKRTG